MHVPDQILSLRADEALRALDLQWFDEGEREFVRIDWLEIWQQIPFDDPFHSDCAARLERCVPLARGTARQRRLSGTTNELVLVYDPQFPEAVFINLSHAMPSRLWLMVEANGQAVVEATRPYLVEICSMAELGRTIRLAKFVDLEDLQTLENALVGFELWLDDATWGSDFNDDPWRSQEGSMSMIDQTIWLRDTASQHPNRFPSKSFRTLWSRSVLTVEQHNMGAWVFELHYRPVAESEAVAFVNEITQSRLPLDLPIDLAASLLRGRNVGHELLADFDARNEALWDRLMIRCALDNGEPTTVATLRAEMLANADDIDMLGGIADLAAAYHHYGLLFELAQQTAGTALGDDIRGFLSPAPGGVA